MHHPPLRLLVIGAHPDDCEIRAGGLAALYRQAGHQVCFVSVTNGESGHQSLHGERLAAIRRQEAAASGQVLGLEYRVLGKRDGHLEPTLAARLELIRLIRQYQPDLLLTHRPCDYHPDHRYTAQLVCDAAYLLTVPAVAPDAPALSRDPVIMYLWDGFQRPYPFAPTVVVDIEPVVESVLDMLVCHRSQMFDWLPFNRGELDRVPAEPAGSGRGCGTGIWDRLARPPTDTARRWSPRMGPNAVGRSGWSKRLSCVNTVRRSRLAAARVVFLLAAGRLNRRPGLRKRVT